MKKLAFVAIVLSMGGLVGSPFLGAELNGDAGCDVPGGVTAIDVTLTNAFETAALQFDVVFETADVGIVDVVGGDSLVDHVFDWNEPAPGTVRVVVYSPTNALLQDGTVVSIDATVDPGATANPVLLELPLNGSGNPAYPGPGAILSSFGAVKSVPDPDPTPGQIDVVSIIAPDPVTSCIGGSVDLSCSATGPGARAYQWTKNGVDIPGATAEDYSIAVAEIVDSGNYACDVTIPSCGAAPFSSDAALLTMEIFPCPPSNLSVYDLGSGGELQATWTPNPSPSVDRYTLNWGNQQSGPYPTTQDLGASNGQTVSQLTDGERYFFRVVAAIGNEESVQSNESDATPTAGALDLPQDTPWGYQPGGNLTEESHPDAITYRFPPRSGDVSVWYDVYDTNDPGEFVSIQINGQTVFVPPPASGWSTSDVVLLPDEFVHDDQPNILTFDNLAFPEILGFEGVWGIRDVSIKLPAPVLAALPWSQTVDLYLSQSPSEPSLSGYDIFRDTFAPFTPTPVNQIASGDPTHPTLPYTNDSLFRDQTGLVNDQDYYYIVRPLDTILKRGFESPEALATPTGTSVTPVVDLLVGRSGADNLSLLWSSVVTAGGVQFYKVYEGQDPQAVVFTGTTTVIPFVARIGEQSDIPDHYYLIGVLDNGGGESLP